MHRPAISVAVPTLGGGGLERVLESLAAQTVAAQVIVVDDGSPSGDVTERAGRFDGVETLTLERNSGFSRACNLAAERADGEALVLLNDDCVVDPHFLERIVAPLDPGAGVSMVASVMRDSAEPELIDSAGMELDRTLLVWDYLNGEPLSILERGVPDPVGPSAAAAAFDRAVFLDAGGFDERLFAYWEDVDLVLRLRAEGHRCRLATNARGTHEHSSTFGSGSARKNYLTGFGRGYVLRKWQVMSARRALAVLARDLVTCAGQAVIDRNVSGVRGRIEGWRAAQPVEEYPVDLPLGQAPRAHDTLRRRFARRARLRSRGEAEKPHEGAEAAGGPDPGRPLRSIAFFHLAETSGPSRSLERELAWLSTLGELEVVIPTKQGEPAGVAATFGEFARVREAPYAALTRARGPLRTGLTLAREVRLFRRLIRAQRAELAVIVTTMVPAALIAARRERIPAVVYCGEIFEQRGMGRSQLLSRRVLAALTGRLAAGIACGSGVVARQFEDAPCGNVEVVYPPIDERYAAGDGARFRRRHGIAADTPLVVAAGAITEGRGQDVLVRAVAVEHELRPALRCMIAGASYEREPDLAFARHLRTLVAGLGLERVVTLAGPIDDVPGMLAAAEVVVNPARFDEPFGRVPFEAALAGTPAIVSRTGAAEELFTDGESALLVEPGDPAALAEAIARLLDDPELGEGLVSGARAFAASKLTPEASLAAFRGVVLRALPRSAAPRG